MCCQNLVSGWLQSSFYQEKPMLSGSLIQSTVYHLWLLATHTCFSWKHLSSLVCCECKLLSFLYSCELFNTFPDTFLVGLLVMYSSLDNDNNSMTSMEDWNAYFCDNYVVNTISPLLWVLICNCFNCYCTILTKQRRKASHSHMIKCAWECILHVCHGGGCVSHLSSKEHLTLLLQSYAICLCALNRQWEKSQLLKFLSHSCS